MTKKTAKDSMSPELITISWNEKMESAYRRMQRQRVRHLPVTNESGEVVGMLSDRDVQRSMISQIERPSGRSVSDETIRFDGESRVRDYMSWPAKSVELGTDLRLVGERMILEKVSSLLVRDGERIVGIVTAEDLIKALVELLSDPKAPKGWTLDRLLEQGFQRLDATLI